MDPLCVQANVPFKALLPLHGRPMLDYVVCALEAGGLKGPYHISGFQAEHDPRLVQAPAKADPASSALEAIEAGIDFPVLLTTADHPLLNADILEAFLSQAKMSGADFNVGLVTKQLMSHTYPQAKRTYLPFSDLPVSGCNLFYLANDRALAALRFWCQMQHLRKYPWRLALQISPVILWRLLFKTLTLQMAFVYMSKRAQISIKPILIPIAEAAIDVDKPADKVLVEAILQTRMMEN